MGFGWDDLLTIPTFGAYTGAKYGLNGGNSLIGGGGGSPWDAMDMSGAPALPSYTKPLNGTKIDAPNVDQGGIERLRALSKDGPQAWQAGMQAKNALDTTAQRDQAGAEGASNIAHGQDAIAMGTGLTSGAAERVQSLGNNDIMNRMQQVGQQSAGRGLDIGIEGGRQQLSATQSLPGQEIANVQPGMAAQEFNVNAGMGAAGAENAFNQNLYGQQAGMFGAGKLAQAQAANGGNSWICAAVNEVKEHTFAQRKALLKLLKFSRRFAPKLAEFYDQNGQDLVKSMRETNFDFHQLGGFVDNICHMIQNGELEMAYYAYVGRMTELAAYYRPVLLEEIVS